MSLVIHYLLEHTYVASTVPPCCTKLHANNLLLLVLVAGHTLCSTFIVADSLYSITGSWTSSLCLSPFLQQTSRRDPLQMAIRSTATSAIMLRTILCFQNHSSVHLYMARDPFYAEWWQSTYGDNSELTLAAGVATCGVSSSEIDSGPHPWLKRDPKGP